VALILGVALLVLPHCTGPAPKFRASPPGPLASARERPSPAVATRRAAGHPANEEPSHLADGLNSPSGDIHVDLRIINEIFRQYRSAVHGLNPVGENAEITAALTGRNSLGFAFIPRDNPAINSHGELCDRWGTPFYFHQLSGAQMEIRSAGPDRKLYTADDDVLTPGIYQPKL
jgi:hypothetical protein